MSGNNVLRLNYFRELKEAKDRGGLAGGGDGGAHPGFWRRCRSLTEPGKRHKHPSEESWSTLVNEIILNTPTLALHVAFTFQGNKGVEENNVRNQYSIPGILHFIQHEWARWIIVCLASKKILPCSPDLRWNDPNGRWKKLNSKLELLFSKVGFEISLTVSWMEQKKRKKLSSPPHSEPHNIPGERKGQENLKNDLVRRIKMLEYALKQA